MTITLILQMSHLFALIVFDGFELYVFFKRDKRKNIYIYMSKIIIVGSKSICKQKKSNIDAILLLEENLNWSDVLIC
jgi:hypothetical protein